jgi:rfaE bifunctional protein nucleotidyltransferase chain/domain
VDKVLNVKQAINIAKELREQGKTVILAGGCFDVLHKGHIYFLKEAKKKGDILMLLVESDLNIKRIKGKDRPVNTQIQRSIVLSAMSFVDYVIPLRGMTKPDFYDKLIVQIKPASIAITVGDINIKKREKQATSVNAELVKIKNLDGISSSSYIEKI